MENMEQLRGKNIGLMREDGGPVYPARDMAFAMPKELMEDKVILDKLRLLPIPHMGITVRQEYAKAAMEGMLADPSENLSPSELATKAFDYADAMLAEERKRYGGL